MSTLILFERAFRGNNVNHRGLTELAMKYGYLVHPDCSTKEVEDYIRRKAMNPNTTFYKTWKDITDKSRLELYLDQIAHYMTTYGTDFKSDNIYLPNNEPIEIDYKSYKMILPITVEEANERACAMLYSGIALKEDTLAMLLSLVTYIDVSKIANREALMYVCKAKKLLPATNTEFVRYLIFLATAKTLLIQNRKTIKEIVDSNFDISSYLTDFGLENAAKNFNRYKNIYLAFKKANVSNKTIINKLGRLSKIYHEPIVIGYFESLLSSPELIRDLPERLLTCSIAKKVQLLETINTRVALDKSKFEHKAFKIRNGKVYVKEEVTKSKDYYAVMYRLIYDSLVEDMRVKATTVRFPDMVKLTIPISEKSFVGNYPIGTRFELGDLPTIVGINWHVDDGSCDLDLSLLDSDGDKYYWDSAYTNNANSVVYSGDMTNPCPEATELFKVEKREKLNGAIVSVNLFRGTTTRFKLFLCSKQFKGQGFTKNGNTTMVDPNDILFNIECAQGTSKQQILGVFTEDCFVLTNLQSGNKSIESGTTSAKYLGYMMNTYNCFLDMETVLRDAGFTIVTEYGEKAEIDLTDLSKDTLINLFTK